MSMGSVRKSIGLLMAAGVLASATGVSAHLMTFKGTVAKVEAARIQVKTVNDEGRENPVPEWFAPTAETKIMRGDQRVSLSAAKITAGERIVVIVDHGDDGVSVVVEVRLAVK